MKNNLITSLIALLFIAGCSSSDQAEEGSVPEQDIEVIAENLEIPWSIDQLNETMYVTERTGSVVKIEDGQTERQSVELKEELSTASEAGLLGFVLAPDFQESNTAYAYYTYEGEDGRFNRIVTLQLEGDVWREEDILLDQIPSGNVHHGGRLKIGPDDKLYAATGDASDADIAQDLDSLGGKILRLNLDGSIPDDNPFQDSYVYSYGHRNPQGMTWSPDGTMYASEHGNSANDEINIIEAGQNYGWPVIEGNEEQDDMISPLFTSGDDSTWAPSGIGYHEEKLYVAALRGTAILEFDLETKEQQTLVSGLGRIRNLYIEGDTLYFISNNTDGRGNPEENDDKLYRVLLNAE
ncbi:PQQ-dependent sugar dehydrogenase [Jeotgalibacillus terrae]|uniref:PQQ-dependent sugar dehydrogenase n=1 Tax=Jeotgalibacillus terrae TaxID=587735 RepID=A0ABW5ZKL4_9BACL|nr:sorbosone dehydrogenase family protein [Jeotgalibacillus terrae]MBM7578215.1 glucose/arabinose dehydrogenase [Jeotgalibacillus terrae]